MGYDNWPRKQTWVGRNADIRLVQGRWVVYWGSSQFNLNRPEGIVVGWTAADAEIFQSEHPGGFQPTAFTYALDEPDPVPTLPDGTKLTLGPVSYVFGMQGMFDRGQDRSTSPSRTDEHHCFMFPAWVTLIVGMIAPMCVVAQRIVRRRSRAEGCCAQCGYDLRASPERCPECGAVPASHLSTGLMKERI